MKNAKRLKVAATYVAFSKDVTRLTAPECLLVAYLFMRFKHHEANVVVSEWVVFKMRTDPAFDAEARDYDKANMDLSESDFELIKRPDAQSAIDKLVPFLS